MRQLEPTQHSLLHVIRTTGLLAGLAMITPVIFAQVSQEPASNETVAPRAVTPPVSSDSRATDEVVVLSPFQVSSERDTGYLATSTLAGTRLRSDLKDIAASISVVTKDFMEDIGANNMEDLLVYTLGTEVSGLGGNFSGAVVGGAGEGLDFQSAISELSSGTRVRGLSSADTTRDFFITSIPMDGFNIERTEISRGPNAMLFGLGSPSGIINSGLIKANLGRDRTTVQHELSSYGSNRVELDHNQSIIADKLALRVAAMYEKEHYRIEPAFVKDKRVYLTGTYEPFASTVLRVSGEWGEQNSNKPQNRPPYDSLSYWWEVGQPVFNPLTGVFNLLSTPQTFDPRVTPSGQPSILPRLLGWAGSNNMALFFSDPNSSQLGVPGLDGVEAVKTASDRVYRNAAGTAWRTDGGMYMLNNSNNYYNRLAAGTPSASFWRMPQMTDPNVFDFYHDQLEGGNKHEWGEWETFNATVEQRFFDNKAGIELVYDRQNLESGNQSPLSYVDYNLRLDLNETMTDGTPNPNYGRPFIGGYGSSNIRSNDREAVRATAFYDLDLTEVGSNWLGKLLGRHLLTGAYTDQRAFSEGFYGPAFSSGPEYWLSNVPTRGQPIASVGSAERLIPQVRYIGPSVIGLGGPSEVRVQGLRGDQWPHDLQTATTLYHQPPATSSTVPTPWVTRDFSVLANPKKELRYITGGSRNETTVESTVFISQSRWFDDHLIGTLGWREDAVEVANAGSVPLDPATGSGLIDNDNYPLLPEPGSALTDTSFNWGVVLHAPRTIIDRIPVISGLSVFYNSADNFRVSGQRFNMYGESIGPEQGEAREYGFRVSLLDDRFELRVAHYENNSLDNEPGSFSTGISNLADGVNGVLDMNDQGFNEDTPERIAGVAAWNEWMASPEGSRYLEVFNFRQIAPGNWEKDRRAGQIVGTSDLVAEGWEYELVFNPTRNWRIAFNAAEQQAIRSNIAPELIDVLENFKALAAGPAGNLRTATNGRFFRDRLRNNTLNVVNRLLLEEGSPSSELRKWRWNLVTNYTFSSGPLKGLGIGVATRMQDKAVIGFSYFDHPELGPAPDVQNPYRGDEQQSYDGWISYSRKLTNRVNWKVQLNIKNIGVGNELLPVSADPDGTISAWRIAEPQKWTLSNTFTF